MRQCWRRNARPPVRSPCPPPAHPCCAPAEVIVIDEIGTEAECMAARTIAQRGVQLVATAHGAHASGAGGRAWVPRGASALLPSLPPSLKLVRLAAPDACLPAVPTNPPPKRGRQRAGKCDEKSVPVRPGGRHHQRHAGRRGGAAPRRAEERAGARGGWVLVHVELGGSFAFRPRLRVPAPACPQLSHTHTCAHPRPPAALQSPPTFDVCVEMRSREQWRLHLDVAWAVDHLLAGKEAGACSTPVLPAAPLSCSFSWARLHGCHAC